MEPSPEEYHVGLVHSISPEWKKERARKREREKERERERERDWKVEG